MDFKSFYQGLATQDRKRFAEMAGTSTGYIEVHLMPRRKIPKAPLMGRLADACAAFNAPITKADLLAFFYQDDVAPATQEAA